MNKVETSHLSAAEIEDKYTQIYVNLCGAGLITVNLYSGAIDIKYLSMAVRDLKIYQLVFEELLVNVIILGYFWLCTDPVLCDWNSSSNSNMHFKIQLQILTNFSEIN